MTRARLAFAAVAGAVLVAACSGSTASPSTSGASQGDENGVCFPNGTCNSGLTCKGKACIVETEGNGTDGGATAQDGGGNPSVDASSDSSLSSDAGPCPGATILHPGPEKRNQGTLIPFVGNARDPLCASITGAKLVWTDNLENPALIGTGTNFDYAFKKVGAHTVTLTATFGAAGQTTASVSFMIE